MGADANFNRDCENSAPLPCTLANPPVINEFSLAMTLVDESEGYEPPDPDGSYIVKVGEQQYRYLYFTRAVNVRTCFLFMVCLVDLPSTTPQFNDFQVTLDSARYHPGVSGVPETARAFTQIGESHANHTTVGKAIHAPFFVIPAIQAAEAALR
jgi:hypothetical protein